MHILIYIILMKESVLSLNKTKNKTFRFPAFKLHAHYYMTYPLNIIFDEFGIALLVDRIEFIWF